MNTHDGLRDSLDSEKSARLYLVVLEALREVKQKDGVKPGLGRVTFQAEDDYNAPVSSYGRPTASAGVCPGDMSSGKAMQAFKVTSCDFCRSDQQNAFTLPLQIILKVKCRDSEYCHTYPVPKIQHLI